MTKYCKNNLIVWSQCSRPEWPDWAILNFRAYKFSYKSIPNTFCAILKTQLFSKNWCKFFWTTFGRHLLGYFLVYHLAVWPVKSCPNVYKICPKMISMVKLNILTPLQKMPKNVGDLGKLIVAKGFEKLPKVQ